MGKQNGGESTLANHKQCLVVRATMHLAKISCLHYNVELMRQVESKKVKGLFCNLNHGE